MKQYVIVGNGIAACGCIEGIRSVDTEGKIFVISKEKHPVYCRPLISYLLEGKTDLNKMGYRPESFYSDNHCEVIYGETATAINLKNKAITISTGESLSYSSLCITTGSSPFIPPFTGLESVKNHFSFLTLDDALALEKAIKADSKVLIVGAGLIGLKCAEGIKDRVSHITVCDLSDRVLSSILDSDTAPIVQKHLEESGVDFLMSDTVTEFKGNKAIMKSGKKLDFDILVTAVGVKANTSLISDIKGEVNKGIIVDDSMKTSLPDIYAAGDCTEGNDITLGSHRILALLPNAYMQGFTAGVNMAGEERDFSNPIPMNSIGFFGLHMMTAGTYYSENDGATVHIIESKESYKKFFVKDGLLKGYILIGDVSRGGMYTSLIREKTDLSTIDFDLLMETPSFVAFSPESRRNKFGGVL